MTIEFYSEAID